MFDVNMDYDIALFFSPDVFIFLKKKTAICIHFFHKKIIFIAFEQLLSYFYQTF